MHNPKYSKVIVYVFVSEWLGHNILINWISQTNLYLHHKLSNILNIYLALLIFSLSCFCFIILYSIIDKLKQNRKYL